jgi:simple sugar transport system ATP-binding protein
VDSQQTPLAEVLGVTKRFGATVALDDVSVAISPGQSHALVGRNGAGKSTLVRILTGLDEPDEGAVRFRGAAAPGVAERERWRNNVACVYQHSTVIPALTVGENLFLNAQPRRRFGMIDWTATRRMGRELLDEWGLDVDIDVEASRLSVGQRQLVEIARALRLGSRFVILDEPTARLEAREIAQLFGHMQRLQAQGVTFLYISHHLEEIHEVCDVVTVLRDGRVVATEPVSAMDKAALVTAMVGADSMLGVRAGAPATPVTSHDHRDAVLEVRGLAVDGWCSDISFTIRAGERVGLGGLAGSGKRQVAEAICGMVAPSAGEVLVDGRRLRPGRVDVAIARGVGYVPQDRHANGFCPNLSVEENLTLAIVGRLGRYGIVEPRRRAARARELADHLQIVASSPGQLTSELSGGNQQKTVMGRALAANPHLLVLVAPTAGVDIASKDALFATIRETHAAVLLVSDEIDELEICDRILIMFDGALVEEFGGQRTEEQLVAAMEGVGS